MRQSFAKYSWLLWVVACLIVILVLLSSSCVSNPNATTEITQCIAAITADGVVTPEELEMLADVIDRALNRPSFDWGTIATTIIGGALTAITGVRFLPNRFVIGKVEADVLKKAANGHGGQS